MTDFNKISFLEGNLSRQLDWISAADSRGSFIFAFDTAMLGVLAAVAPKTGSVWVVAPAIVASFSALFGLASLLFLCFSSFPRMDGPRNSLIFFGGITERDSKQFVKAVSELSSESYVADLSAQCYRNAEIANRKFIWIKRALIALYLSVVPWVVAIILLYNA